VVNGLNWLKIVSSFSISPLDSATRVVRNSTDFFFNITFVVSSVELRMTSPQLHNISI
jgi:hypothetical protein